jgi:NAD-dependent SIR2 family protein deacetylase
VHAGDEDVYWFTSHVDHSIIVWSSHPKLVPPTESQLGLSCVVPGPLGESLASATSFFEAAEAVLTVAGAGCSVDSGLPDFRGSDGWYRIDNTDISMDHVDFHPGSDHFLTSWGLIASMTSAFRKHVPHAGYDAVVTALFRNSQISGTLRGFVITSNIDGYFERAGVPASSIYEAHGAVNYLQCTSVGTSNQCEFANTLWWFCDELVEKIDAACLARGSPNPARDLYDLLPHCQCGALARPNVSHTTDTDEEICTHRKRVQRLALLAWLAEERAKSSKLLVVEVGCGNSPHSLRLDAEIVVSKHRNGGGSAAFIRIDPINASVPIGENHLAVAAGAETSLIHIFGSGETRITSTPSSS